VCHHISTGLYLLSFYTAVDSSWNVMAHGDAPEGKWSGNWRMEWVASTLHTTLEHGVSSIITADAHTSAASSRLNWRPRRFKRTRPFRWKTKSGSCACAITFQTQSTNSFLSPLLHRNLYREQRQIHILCLTDFLDLLTLFPYSSITNLNSLFISVLLRFTSLQFYHPTAIT